MKNILTSFLFIFASLNINFVQAESVIKKHSQKKNSDCPLCQKLQKTSEAFDKLSFDKGQSLADETLATAQLSADPKIRDQEFRSLFPLAIKVIKREKNSDFSDYLFAIYDGNKDSFEAAFVNLAKEKVITTDEAKLIKENIEHRRKIQEKGEEADGQ